MATHCLHAIPSNCAFCIECGARNPNFDKQVFTTMHPARRSYEDAIQDCLEGHSDTIRSLQLFFADELNEGMQYYCPDCGTQIP